MRQLNGQLLSHPLDPAVTIKLQHAIGKRLLPERSGRLIVPTAYGFPMIIDVDTTHTPSMQGSIERNLYFLGTYEAGTLDIIRLSLDAWGDGVTFIDIGAHTGMMSLYAAHSGADRVVAFEPNPSVFEVLQANVALTGFSNITALALALGETSRRVAMETDDQNSGATHVTEADTAALSNVPMRTLDELVQEQAISSVQLMLIDIEGYELQALRGAERTIATHKPDLIVEYDPRGYDERVLTFLRNHGYELYVLEHSRHIVGALIPFRVSTVVTQQDNLFCFQPDRAAKLGLC